MFVEVAVNLPPVRGTFHYHVPQELEGQVEPGHLVTAPFGHRRVQGVVIGLPEKPEVPETRPIEGLVDPRPVLNPLQLELARWLQRHTLAALIDCLTLMLPPGLSQRADSLYALVLRDERGRSRTEARLIDLLSRRGPLRGRQIARAMPRTDWRRAAESLTRRGVLARTPVLDPPRVRARRVRTLRLALPPEELSESAVVLGRPGGDARRRRESILEALTQARAPVEVRLLYDELGAKPRDVRFLVERGLATVGESEVWRDPLAQLDFVPATPPTLTSDQQAAWNAIRAALHDPQPVAPSAFLLHGVTGSGKTEIYLRGVQEVLHQGRSAIVLVPEIALTPQTVRRFVARFPGQVGVLHSQLSEGERYDTWRRCREGLLQVVVGPRSALFAPLQRLGFISVDECHDESYKEQGQPPYYHARDTALAYARLAGAVCVLGSATPDVVTFYQAEKGLLRALDLPQRILGHRRRLDGQAARLGVTSRYRPTEAEADSIELPPVRVVDMRHELRAGNPSMFSRALQRALQEVLDAGQQAILFLNRRGASTYVFCRDCGKALHCPRCETPLTYHTAQARLLCHHCGYARSLPSDCPHCQSPRIRHFGAGTQRVVSEIQRLHPSARILRWDWDTTRTKGAHQAILDQFARHQADLLVGTQMVAKGLDLPLVTLVGVISADVGLHLPDYRAAERTFQVLTQVSGRAGRGLLGGRVILQTYQPDHYAIRAASAHDYRLFYRMELRHRRQLGYPPFRRLARLVYRHVSESVAQAEAERMARRLEDLARKADPPADLIGPVPCFYRRVRGLHRWQIVIRALDPAPLVPSEISEGWTVDMDPVSLL